MSQVTLVQAAYDAWMQERKAVASQVKREFKAKITAEIESRTEKINAEFGSAIRFGLENGMTRGELAEAVRSNDWQRLKTFLTYAGNEGLSKRAENALRHSEEREQAMKLVGILEADEEAREATVTTGLRGELSKPYRVRLFATENRGRLFPKVVPVDSEENESFRTEAKVFDIDENTKLASRFVDALGWTLTLADVRGGK